MDANRFFRVDQSQIETSVGASPSPAFYHDMGFTSLTLMASLRAIKSRLKVDVKPIAILPDKGLINITCFEYRNSDLGAYNEVCIATLVHRPKTRLLGPIEITRQLRAFQLHLHVLELPLTERLPMAYGCELYGFPKYIRAITFDKSPANIACQVDDTSGLEISINAPNVASRNRHPKRLWLAAYQTKGIGNFELNLLEFGFSRLLPHRSSYSIDRENGALAHIVEDLQIGRCLQIIQAPKVQGILYGPAAGPFSCLS